MHRCCSCRFALDHTAWGENSLSNRNTFGSGHQGKTVYLGNGRHSTAPTYDCAYRPTAVDLNPMPAQHRRFSVYIFENYL